MLDPASDRGEVLADLVLNVGRKIENRTGANLGPATLTHIEMLVLRQVARRPGITPSALAGQLGLRSSNTSAVLRKLEERDLIARRSCGSDRRAVNVVLTSTAGRLVGDVSRFWRDLLEPLLPPGADMHAVVGLLRALDAALGD